MTLDKLDFSIETLGEKKIANPMKHVQFINLESKVLFNPKIDVVKEELARGEEPPAFSIAGPREKYTLTLPNYGAEL